MSFATVSLWLGYIVTLLVLSHLAKGKDALLPGKIGVAIQSMAYVATYISAVALVGFSGLGHIYGLQIEMIALGNIWLGVWFVYRYLAWPTKLMQRKLLARTPVQLLSRGYRSPGLGRFFGVLAGLLILVYCSAVFKGGALILTSAVPLDEHQALWLLVALVATSVLWGGLRAVLYTEALQGVIMAVGVIAIVVGTLSMVGGPMAALEKLALEPPTENANNGFLALSSGAPGMQVIFLAFVTSVGVWAQPQMIQRHFALKSKAEAQKVIPLAMIWIALLLGGAYFVGSVSRLVLGPEIASPDHVIPAMVKLILPELGRQIFALAIVSAALSTASALLHVSCGLLGQDVLGRSLRGAGWYVAVALGALASGYFAVHSSSIIALICATSWSIIASAMLVPYLTLIIKGLSLPSSCAWISSVSGLSACLGWYFFASPSTSLKISGMAAPGLIGGIHPLFIGLVCSAMGMGLGLLLAGAQKTESGPRRRGKSARFVRGKRRSERP
jgi:Na+/panthothenate symporter